MLKYKQVDRDFLQKFFDILSKLNRSCSNYRKDKKCNREIFIRRTLNKWISGKYFEVILNEKTGFTKFVGAFDSEDITIPRKNYVYIMSIEFGLGWSDYINFTVSKAGNVTPIEVLKFSYNDFLDIKFRKSTEKKFKSVQNMFNDDSVK